MTFDRGLRAMPFADRDERSERPSCSLSRIRTTQQAMRENSVPSPNCAASAPPMCICCTSCAWPHVTPAAGARPSCTTTTAISALFGHHCAFFLPSHCCCRWGGAENWGYILRRREAKEVAGLSAWLRSNDINCLGDISGASGASRAREHDEPAWIQQHTLVS
jgi:hypothetical protein